MPRLKAEAGLEPNRRAELLRAAARLVVEKGFAATTTRDIAEAVGMRSGSPVYHFQTVIIILTRVKKAKQSLRDIKNWQR